MNQTTCRWNHNLHHHPLVLGAVSEGASSALDVGCGEGILARELRSRVGRVVGIDLHEASVARARAGSGALDGVDFVVGDFLTYPFHGESFDLVVSVAALHHMDASAAIARMRELVRPGGAIAVIGLARSTTLTDLSIDLAAVIANRAYRATRRYWEPSSPTVWPPPESYASMCRIAERELPGVRFRRHLLWRYSLVWTKPRR